MLIVARMSFNLSFYISGFFMTSSAESILTLAKHAHDTKKVSVLSRFDVLVLCVVYLPSLDCCLIIAHAAVCMVCSY